MGRIRELLAHGGIAPLAALFAIGFATVGLADAVAQAVMTAIQQHTLDPESGGSGFDFRLLGTDFELFYVMQAALALLLVACLLFGISHLGRARRQECPECRSEIPREARVCRFCTTDLPSPGQ